MSTPASGTADQLPHGIKGLVAYHIMIPNLWLILIGVLVFLALSILGYWAWKRYRNRPKKPPEHPILLARRALSELAPQEPFTRKAAGDYYYALSLEFRRFIELTSRVHATDLTLQELKEPIRSLNKLRPKSEDVIGFFVRADMIKFADQASTIEEARDKHVDVCAWADMLMPGDEELRLEKLESAPVKALGRFQSST